MLQNLPKLVSPVLSLLPRIISQYSSVSNSWFLTYLYPFSIFISRLELKTKSIQWHQTVYTLDVLISVLSQSTLTHVQSLVSHSIPLLFHKDLPDWPIFVYLCARHFLSLNLQNIHVISYFRLLVFAQIISIYWVVPYITFKILPPPSENVFLFSWFIFFHNFFLIKSTYIVFFQSYLLLTICCLPLTSGMIITMD